MMEAAPETTSSATGVMGDHEAVALVATTLHETLRAAHAGGNAGATHRAIGARLGVAHQHVSEWCDPLSGRVLKLTRAVRLGSTLAPAFLRALASKIEARGGMKVDLRDAALGVQEAAGGLARCVREVLADGEIDDAEDRALEAALLAAEAEIAAVRAARAQHRARSAR